MSNCLNTRPLASSLAALPTSGARPEDHDVVLGRQTAERRDVLVVDGLEVTTVGHRDCRQVLLSGGLLPAGRIAPRPEDRRPSQS